jgi:DNA-binding transcriptional LysR family regulator
MDYFLAVQAFVRIVETGSFVKASALMNLHPNVVTKLIQSLESHLRVKLLNRTTRKVTLTNDGSIYYERMNRVMDQWLEAESDLAISQENPKGKLRIDMGSTMASLLVIPALPAFYARYPELQLDIGVGDRTVDLASDNVDCVIRGGKLEDSSLVARRLGALPFVTCATPAYLATHAPIRHPSELEEGQTLVRYFYANAGRQSPFEFKSGSERIVVRGTYFISVNDSNAHLAAGLAGLGVIQTLTFMAQPHIDAGTLVPILQDWNTEPSPISIVYMPNRHLSTRVRTFVNWLVDFFRAHPQTIA